MMGLKDNEAVVNSHEVPARNGGNVVQNGNHFEGMPNGQMTETGASGMHGVPNASVTSKFNNNLIHSEKDSNGNALVNSTQNY